MAKAPRIRIAAFVPEPDPRRPGFVQFADPSTARMTRDIHTFNEPPSRRAIGNDQGIRTPFGQQAPWSQTMDGEQVWREMNRKRGVSDEE